MAPDSPRKRKDKDEASSATPEDTEDFDDGWDPETEAIFEASYERNKEAMERLAKL